MNFFIVPYSRFLVLGKQKKNGARNTTRIRASRPYFLTASHSQLRYFLFFFLISRRDGENNGFLAGIPPTSSPGLSPVTDIGYGNFFLSSDFYEGDSE